MSIKSFMQTNYRHFNAATCVAAADAWVDHLNSNGKMFLTLAGAMSTAELGISLAALIRSDKVHAICCTGANLEEDLFNLVAHNHYKRIPDYRHLSPEDEAKLHEQGFNRVTDTCIPEETAIRAIEKQILQLWQEADKDGKSRFPYEYLFDLLKKQDIIDSFQGNPEHSWLIAASEKNIPIFTPGWEDSTLANIFVAHVIRKDVSSFAPVKTGLELMESLVQWYRQTAKETSLGFFQIGGGIAGDFPICVVPLIEQDLQENCPKWGYFCQIGDSTTSYGSYSGAVPSEKISWGKLTKETPQFMIESDASIVAPLIFNYVLES